MLTSSSYSYDASDPSYISKFAAVSERERESERKRERERESILLFCFDEWKLTWIKWITREWKKKKKKSLSLE